MPPETPASACAHVSAHSTITMHQGRDPETGDYLYTVTLRMTCVQCGSPVYFTGLPAGPSRGTARVSADGTEARLPVMIGTPEDKPLRCPDCSKILPAQILGGTPRVPVTVECGPVHRVTVGETRWAVLPDGSTWTREEDEPADDGER